MIKLFFLIPGDDIPVITDQIVYRLDLLHSRKKLRKKISKYRERVILARDRKQCLPLIGFKPGFLRYGKGRQFLRALPHRSIERIYCAFIGDLAELIKKLYRLIGKML